jgi:Holliday junction DNA helicase RuvA
MIVGVRGALAATGPDWVHVSVGGVTLQVFVPSNTIAALGPAGSIVSLNTLLRFRDEQPILYGFPDDATVQLFTLLTGVSGVGPRLALALLSSMDSASLQLAVASGDAAALAAAPGVGRRIANRIILELRGKVDEIEGTPGTVSADDVGEVLAALTALGYSASEVRAAVGAIPESDGLTVEDKIRLALQQFAQR